MEEIKTVNRRRKFKVVLRKFLSHLSSGHTRDAVDNNIDVCKRDYIGVTVSSDRPVFDGDCIECRLRPGASLDTSEPPEEVLFPYRIELRVGNEPGDVFIARECEVYPSIRYCFSCGERKMHDQKEDEYFCPIHDEAGQEEAKGLLQTGINLFS